MRICIGYSGPGIFAYSKIGSKMQQNENLTRAWSEFCFTRVKIHSETVKIPREEKYVSIDLHPIA